MKEVNKDVLKWLPAVREVRDELGLSRAKYSDALMLALIEIESGGDEHAHRAGAPYYGLLQIGRSYAIDASEYLKEPKIAPSDLSGRDAIRYTLAYFERYSASHQYNQTQIAALHKGGAGTARVLAKKVAALPRHVSIMQAVRDTEEQTGLPRYTLYVERFRSALHRWSLWVEEYDREQPLYERAPKVAVICSPGDDVEEA